MAQIRILFLYPNEFFGPEMTVFSQVLRHLDRSRFAPYLAVNEAASGRLPIGEADGVTISRWSFGVAFHGSRIGGARSLLSLPGAMLSLARYARRENIDVIHCASTPRTAALGWLLARLSGARLLVHYHVIAGRYAGPRRMVENFVARRADRAVAVSEFLGAQIRRTGLRPEQIDVVANGTDLAAFTPAVDGTSIRAEYGIAPNDVLVLQLARVIQQKRQADLVRAFAIARRSAPNLRLLIVGWEDPRYDGPFDSYMAELRAIAEEEQLGESITFAPARPEAPRLVAAADLVAMPSDGDAWNLAVTEAMASAKPVIGSMSGGIPEQIVDGITGYLVPLGDVEALAARLVRLAQDADLRVQMGRMGRQRAEACFGEAKVAEGFAAVYERLFDHESATPATAIQSP